MYLGRAGPLLWRGTSTQVRSAPVSGPPCHSRGPQPRPKASIKSRYRSRAYLRTLGSGIWTSLPFTWTPTQTEGIYQIQVVIKDFTSGETTSQTERFRVLPLVSGSTPVAVPTANPLEALFSAPSCAAGSSMRAWFQPQSRNPAPTTTNWVKCHPPATMTFEVAGMYPNTKYNMFSQTLPD